MIRIATFRMWVFVVLTLFLRPSSSDITTQPSWDGKGCPKGATGQFPYAFDCKRFFNCFKGRGSLTVCSPGTLFNPKTLECDFPAKVDCYTAPENRVARLSSANYEESRDYQNPQQHHHHHHHLAAGQSNSDSYRGGFRHTSQYHQAHRHHNHQQHNGPYGYSNNRSPNHQVPTYTPQDRRYRGQKVYQQEDGQQVVGDDIQGERSKQEFTQSGPGYPTYGVQVPSPDLQPPISSGLHGGVQPPNVENRRTSPSNPVYSSVGKNDEYPKGRDGNPVKFPDPSSQTLSSSGPSYPSSSFGNPYSGLDQSADNRGYQGGYQPHGQYQPSNQEPKWNRKTPLSPGSSQQQPPFVYTDNRNSTGPQLFYPNPSQHVPNLFYPVNTQTSTPYPNNGQPQNSFSKTNPSQSTDTYIGSPATRPGNINGQPTQNLPYPSMFNSKPPTSALYEPTSAASANSFNSYIPPVNRGSYNPEGNPLRAPDSDRTQPGGFPNSPSEPVHLPGSYRPGGSQLTNTGIDSTDVSYSNTRTKVVMYSECPSDFSGLLPHFNCAKFLSCAHGRTYLMDCGPGTRFHPENLVCVHPHQVKCASSGDDVLVTSETANEGQFVLAVQGCSEDEYSCDKQRCIPKSRMCDGITDCFDLTDELNCADGYVSASSSKGAPTTKSFPAPSVGHQNGESPLTCSSEEFTCDSGLCIHLSRVCDGVVNCFDRTDETNCQAATGSSKGVPTTKSLPAPSVGHQSGKSPLTCSSEEFTCDGGLCIHSSRVCDGIADCFDRTDETKCQAAAGRSKGAPTTKPFPVSTVGHQNGKLPLTCSSAEFTCDGGLCIHSSRVCDGIDDCFDRTDETKCQAATGSSKGAPTTKPFPLPTVGHQNGKSPLTCSSEEFTCDSGLCIHPSRVCDGIIDCFDRTDETECHDTSNVSNLKPTEVSSTTPSAPYYCTANEFSCDNGTCFHVLKLCDYNQDCIDGSDEINCPENAEELPPPELDVRFGQTIEEDVEEFTTTPRPVYRPHPANATVRGFFIKPTEVSVVKSVQKVVGNRTSKVSPAVEVSTQPSIPVDAPQLESGVKLAQHNKYDRQVVRLRGGPTQMEGYVEMRFTKNTWGAVCDQKGQWTLEEATLVCQNLGYSRGAEISWQGKPASANISLTKSDIVIDTVRCSGSEDSIAECFLAKGSNCDIERDITWVRCLSNAKSLCHPGEISFNEKCYRLVVPTEDMPTELAGFSQGEALSHCQKLGGHLIGIQSQIENDYVSEWLMRVKEVDVVMTSGVGVSVMGMPIWIWEGSEEPFSYQNWWPGWRSAKFIAPTTSTGRASCIVLKRFFPCPDFDTGSEDRLCDAQYYFWDTVDCGTMSSKLPYVCKRPANKIGCVMGTGVNYRGGANVTNQGNLCLSWDSPGVSSYLKYKLSDDDRKLTLSGHNFCRNVGGSDTEPWCFVDSSQGLKKEYCDIPHCSKGVERSAKFMEYKCSQKMFSCEFDKECIPKDWVCDGKSDCTNGQDESNCEGMLQKFTHFPQSKLSGYDIAKWVNTSLASCAQMCVEDENCRSFSHFERSQDCYLSESNVGLSGSLISGEPHWNYYERNSKTMRCNGLFVCDNGKCLSSSSLCNGRDECGDKSDERNCSWLEQGIQLKLVGGKSKSEGTIQVKALGEWGLICDDQFDINDAHVVCRHLGFSLGAKELRNDFGSPTTSVNKFLIDDLNCTGSESTIADCAHNGWGVHNCNQEEAAGISCKTVEIECSHNYWQCRGAAECIPLGFLCDNVTDCQDKSDEDPANCKEPFSVRLVGVGGESRSNKVTEGRLEVKRHGVWGTVCDDDFGPKEAEVICNSLGYQGPAKAYKEAAFGAGSGIIWMDQVHCFGNETNLADCMHDSWGQTNCKHDEDVAVACSPQKYNMDPKQNLDVSVKTDTVKMSSVSEILPKECGVLSDDFQIPSAPSIMMQRVVSGFETTKGTYPWQASVRVRNIYGKNTHWCGAIVITSHHVLTAGHCLRDYIKTAYTIRAGDFDSETNEGTEQDLEVDQIWIHPDLDKETRLNNDIGIVKVKGPGFKFDRWVTPACLPPKSASYTAGRNCTISGWGSKTPGSAFVRTLHATWLPILPSEDCKAKKVYGSKAITSGMFCAGSLQGGVDSCQGDSGGPFLCPENGNTMTIFGITSWGLGCGRSNSPGVYTNVLHYLDWIHDTIVK